MIRIVFLVGFLFWFQFGFTQSFKQVYFTSSDNLQVSADEYVVDNSLPYIILLHQAKSSRGEFREIALRFNKLNYNCLAVDLRSGDEKGGVANETAQRAKNSEKNAEYLDAIQDIVGAIDYVSKKSKKPVILLGSSYSASLALVVGKDDNRVGAVMAFSPGEYFDNTLNVQKTIAGFNKPLFAACPADEEPYVTSLLSNVTSNKKLLFAPSRGGKHGAKTLMKSNPNSGDYWLNIINFLKLLKN